MHRLALKEQNTLSQNHMAIFPCYNNMKESGTFFSTLNFHLIFQTERKLQVCFIYVSNFLELYYKVLLLLPEIHSLPEIYKPSLCLTIHAGSSRYPKIAQDLSLLVNFCCCRYFDTLQVMPK